MIPPISMLLFFLIFLCIGSFLNVVGYRLLRNRALTGRSHCPHCNHVLAWYDLIPLFSYSCLRGKCRYCTVHISLLYPFIELITAIALSLLFLCTSINYWFAYSIFFCALIVTVRTDLEAMLISRFVTLFLVPFGWFFSYFQLLPITLTESLLGTLSAYVFLYAIERFYFLMTKRIGMGLGDIELLTFIGSFTGFMGWWTSLLIGSLSGSLYGIILMILSRHYSLQQRIPFGPFLAFGAMIYVILQPMLFSLLYAVR